MHELVGWFDKLYILNSKVLLRCSDYGHMFESSCQACPIPFNLSKIKQKKSIQNLPRKSEGEAANPLAAAAAKWPRCKPGCCSMAGTLCGRIGLAAALELELELGEAGESAPLRFRPKPIPFAGSPFWWLLLPVLQL